MGYFSHKSSLLGPVLRRIEEIVNRQAFPIFDVIQPHLSGPSPLSSLSFCYAWQQFLADAVSSGDMTILR